MTTIKIKPLKNCIKANEDLELIFENLKIDKNDAISIYFDEIKEDYTDFSFQKHAELKSSGKSNIIIKSDFKEGLYIISKITIQNASSGNPESIYINNKDFNSFILKIINESDDYLPSKEILKEFKNIMAERENDFNKGFGEGSQEFTGLFFVKDCKIGEMRLGQYEIISANGLPCNDEVNLIQNFVNRTSIDLQIDVQDTLTKCISGQPTIVIHFPSIKGDNIDEAGLKAENEVKILCDLLSMHKDGYPSIFGAVLKDKSTNLPYYKINTPFYKANLMTGPFTGEDPRLIKKRMENVRNNDTFQLYLELYNETRKERRIEFIYFRLWNILEVIGGSKGFKGQIKKDWNGNSGKDWDGNPITNRKLLKIKHKKEIVYELIRTVFNHVGLGENSLECGLDQGLIRDMIHIWYQHRNCVVHGGGCFPNDPNFCSRTDTYQVKCKMAHDEIIRKHGERDEFYDFYLKALKETVKAVIGAELE